MTKDELNEILENHKKWLDEKGGQRAYLINIDLTRADLSGADLSGASLFRANLVEANLTSADLMEADLTEANLFGAKLPWTYLKWADLSSAKLAEADLMEADLSGANLASADLSGANLMGAYLSKANLIEADLSGVNLKGATYAVTAVLRINWGKLSDTLTLELMAHNAESCGIKAMDKWAKGGTDPFKYSEPDFYFEGNKTLWRNASPAERIPKLRGRTLLIALCEEKGIKL